ncbi:MAG: non-homologous end-joining DNA ligase, partial [Gordonia sp. (in: high G+C Gram-positive bacteria)]
MARGHSLEIDGHRIALTNLTKVLYPPVSGPDGPTPAVRKFEVIDYYTRVADIMLPHLYGRLITRKRWPNGIASASFFEKDLPASTPDWVPRFRVEHREGPVTYVMADSAATLVWLAQLAALELHTPQWRVPPLTDDEPGAARLHTQLITDHRTNRLVLDLDPGPSVSLNRCAEVALLVKEILSAVHLPSYPVTSGSKGIHVYARFDKPVAADSARTVAHEIAHSLAGRHPHLITASMSASERAGRVFIDWSQNSAAKTTLAPYSLRGRTQPWVAAPRTWAEIASGKLTQLLYPEVLDRIRDGDLLGDLDAPYAPDSTATPSDHVIDLREYRRKRNESIT